MFRFQRLDGGCSVCFLVVYNKDRLIIWHGPSAPLQVLGHSRLNDRPQPLQVDDSSLDRGCRSLSPVLHAQLGQDVLHVVFDRVLGDP